MGVISVNCLLNKTYGVLSNVFVNNICLILKIKFIRYVKNRDTIFKAKHTTPNITDGFDATPPKSGSMYLSKDYVDVYTNNFGTVP